MNHSCTRSCRCYNCKNTCNSNEVVKVKKSLKRGCRCGVGQKSKGDGEPNASSFTNFISHGHSRLSNSFNLKTPICETSPFQASYLNGIVKLWNYSCSIAPSSSFSSPLSFQLFVKQTLFDCLRTSFDID